MQEMKIVDLRDGDGHICGAIEITRLCGATLEGTLTPTKNFNKYTHIFRAHEHAANNQLFIEVDRIEMDIDALGFFIEIKIPPSGSTYRAIDLQIMSDEVVMKIGPAI